MTKQELCQFLSKALFFEDKGFYINYICNCLWNELVRFHDLSGVALTDLHENPQFINWLKQLNAGMPVEYVIGSSCFYGIDLEVNQDVLIPRSETEELVHWILLDHPATVFQNILDIGTGSGCIAIAVKKNRPHWKINAIDNSYEALAIAKRNAQRYSLEIEFNRCDILSEIQVLKGEYDLIVSNPPYISKSEQDRVAQSVINYEPNNALFAPGSDPLIFYKKIAEHAKRLLKNGGKIYLELNEFMTDAIFNIFKTAGYTNLELRKDFQGKTRMLKVHYQFNA